MSGGAILVAFFIWCFAGLVAVAAAAKYDQLVRLQHKSYRDNWERDGRPLGYFWKPQDVGTFRPLSGTRGRMLSKWLFSTPEWIRMDPRARRLVVEMRVLGAIVVALFLLGVAIVLISML